MMQSLFSKDMMKKVFCQGYLWLLLLLLYSPIFIIIIFSFTEAKVMGNWTGFSLQLYKNLFAEGTHHSLTAALVNTVTIALITATVSTLFGTLTAIGIYNLRNRYARNAIQFVNNIPILNGDIIIGISLFLLFITLGIPQGEGFFLVVGNVYEGNAQAFVHLLQLQLHVFTHLEVFCVGISLHHSLYIREGLYLMLTLFCVSVFYCIYMIIQEMIRRKNMLETMAATDLLPYVRYSRASVMYMQ